MNHTTPYIQIKNTDSFEGNLFELREVFETEIAKYILNNEEIKDLLSKTGINFVKIENFEISGNTQVFVGYENELTTNTFYSHELEITFLIIKNQEQINLDIWANNNNLDYNIDQFIKNWVHLEIIDFLENYLPEEEGFD
jgi:hypothetical protein